MRIQVREFASDKNPLRYLVTVDKPGGLQSEYVVEFKEELFLSHIWKATTPRQN
jgi:hypothetical protein